MIYRSFFKKKITKIYLWIFILFSILFSFLFIAKEWIIVKGNEAYKGSFIYFVSKEDIDLSRIYNIKKYNKALYANCHSDLVDIFVVNDKPIVNNDNNEKVECALEGYTIKYSVMDEINIVQNDALYKLLNNKGEDYYYFISLNNWFDVERTSSIIKDVYKVEPIINEINIDSNNYKDYIYIFNIIIKVLLFLFVLLLLVSIVNVIIDEKKNNKLYYFLGYSKIRIACITFNKILFLMLMPMIIFLLLLIVGKIVL